MSSKVTGTCGDSTLAVTISNMVAYKEALEPHCPGLTLAVSLHGHAALTSPDDTQGLEASR